MTLITQADRMEPIPFSGIRKVFEEANRLQKEGKKIINLGIGRPDFDTPSHIKDAAIEALNNGLVHYTSNYGAEGLLNAIKEKLAKENGIEMDEKELIVTAGVNEAVALAFFALLNPGDEVLVPNPCWPHYFRCAELVEAKSVSYPLTEEDHFNLNPKEIEKRITSKTKMIIINTPNNPTGAVASKDALEEVAALAKKYDLLVLSDEIYEKLLYEDCKHYSLASFPGMKERTLTVNGFSKAYSMTGWRIGYMAAAKPFIDAMIRVHQYTVVCATSFAQYGAESALRGSQSCVKEMRSEFDRRRKLVVDRIGEIDGLSVSVPQGAFYAFINIKSLGMSSEEAARFYLREAGVALVPGSAFGNYGEGYVRASFANSYENIKEAMDKIEVVTQSLK